MEINNKDFPAGATCCSYINAQGSFTGSGLYNGIQNGAHFSGTASGGYNCIDTGSTYSFIGGGSGNHITAPYSTISAGYTNCASGFSSFIGNGGCSISLSGGNKATKKYA